MSVRCLLSFVPNICTPSANISVVSASLRSFPFSLPSFCLFLPSACLVSSKNRHPNVVLFMGFCATKQKTSSGAQDGNDRGAPGTVEFTMVVELCEEGSAYDYMKRRTRPSKGEHRSFVAQLAVDAAMGMCYLHGHDPPVLHLDLKSPNVSMARGLCTCMCLYLCLSIYLCLCLSICVCVCLCLPYTFPSCKRSLISHLDPLPPSRLFESTPQRSNVLTP